jgi:hypothetical protein
MARNTQGFATTPARRSGTLASWWVAKEGWAGLAPRQSSNIARTDESFDVLAITTPNDKSSSNK